MQFPISRNPNPILAHMSLAPSPFDRLVKACIAGDLPSVKAAIGDGASVNEGSREGWLPLTAAVANKHDDVVAWLLSCGADPNGDCVLFQCVYYGTTALLQLLIDVGSDVNRSSNGQAPVFWSIFKGSEPGLALLLAQPDLDLGPPDAVSKTPEHYARCHDDELADMIAREVSELELPCGNSLCLSNRWWGCVSLTGRKTRVAGTTSTGSLP